MNLGVRSLTVIVGCPGRRRWGQKRVSVEAMRIANAAWAALTIRNNQAMRASMAAEAELESRVS